MTFNSKVKLKILINILIQTGILSNLKTEDSYLKIQHWRIKRNIHKMRFLAYNY